MGQQFRSWSLVTALVLGLVLAGLAPAGAQSNGTGGAQSRTAGDLVISGLPPGTVVNATLRAMNGVKTIDPVTATSAGTANVAIDWATSPKPEGFKGTAYLDTCATGTELHVVEDGAPVPPLPPGCTRRRKRAVFGPDQPVQFSAAQPTPQVPAGALMGGYTSDPSPLTIVRKQEVDVLQLDGVPFDEDRSTTVDPNLETGVDIRASGTTIAVPLPGGGGTTAGALGLFAAQSPAARGGGSRLVTHHAIVSIGRAEAELDFRNRESGGNTQWTGTGVHWGIGYGALIELCGDCHWFLNTSYVYSKLPATDMSRSPALDFTPSGGRLTRDEGSFEWHAHAVEATVGRATRYIFPYAGLRTAVRGASLAGHVDVDYPLSSGRLGQLRNSIQRRVREDDRAGARRRAGTRAADEPLRTRRGRDRRRQLARRRELRLRVVSLNRLKRCGPGRGRSEPEGFIWMRMRGT